MLLAFLSMAVAAPRWDKIEQHYSVQPDGTVRVLDMRSVTGGAFTDVAVCIPHPDHVTISPLPEFTGLIDPPGAVQLRQQPCTYGTELVLAFGEHISQYTIEIQVAYVIDQAIIMYEDVAAWRWRILPPSESILWNFEANIAFPGSLPSPFNVFIHQYRMMSEPDTTWLGIRRELRIERTGIMPENAYDIHALMPPSLFRETGTGRALQALLDEENTHIAVNSVRAPLLTLDPVGDVDLGRRFAVTGKTSQLRLLYPITITAQVGTENTVTCLLGDEGLFTCPITLTQDTPTEIIVSAVDNEGRRSLRRVEVVPGQRPEIATPPALPETTDPAADVPEPDDLLEPTGATQTDETTGTPLPSRNTPAPAIASSNVIQYAVVGYILILSVGILGGFFGTDRSRVKQAPGRTFTPPRHIRPQYVALRQTPLVGQQIIHRAITAIIFELARRGHLTLQRKEGNLAVTLHPNPDRRFVQSELSVLEFFAQFADAQGVVHGPVFRRLLTRAGRGFAMQLRKDLMMEFQKLPGNEARPTGLNSPANTWSLLSAIGIVGWTVVLMLVPSGVYAWPAIAMAASAVFGNLAAFALPAYRAAMSEHQQYWKAYVATLKDPTAYTAAPQEFYGRWDEHLPYTAAAGVTARYCYLLYRTQEQQSLPEHAMLTNAQWLGNVGVTDLTNLPVMFTEVAEHEQYLTHSIAGRRVSLSATPNVPSVT